QAKRLGEAPTVVEQPLRFFGHLLGRRFVFNARGTQELTNRRVRQEIGVAGPRFTEDSAEFQPSVTANHGAVSPAQDDGPARSKATELASIAVAQEVLVQHT